MTAGLLDDHRCAPTSRRARRSSGSACSALTVPALSIKGEIGQQLGYIVAGSAALGDFVILVIIGWMYSHKPETFRFFRFITRGRFRPPPEDEYTHLAAGAPALVAHGMLGCRCQRRWHTGPSRA